LDELAQRGHSRLYLVALYPGDGCRSAAEHLRSN
jgi:hypothetical protein